MKNKRILITGGAGSIGSELARQLCNDNEVYIFDVNETEAFDVMCDLGIKGKIGDICDCNAMENVFCEFEPDVVFHAAARKHVSPMENNYDEAIRVNVVGAANVLRASKKHGIEKFVFISTDKAVQATSVMGATKRLGEVMTKNCGDGYVVVRFGNVLGSRGSVIPIWQKQIESGKNLTITDERMTRYMMTIDEAVSLVIKAAEIGKGGEIIIFEMGEAIKIIDLAKQILLQARSNARIDIIGARPGEQLHETLMTEEEKKAAIKNGKFLIIK